MPIDPDRLEDFVPIKRGYNKKAFYGAFYSTLGFSFLVFALSASWPLEGGISWWGAIIYALGGAGTVWLLHHLGGGVLKGMLIIPGYFLFVYFICMLGMGYPLSYVMGILTLMLYVPLSGVLGWILSQGTH